MNEKVLDERKVERLTRWLKFALIGIVSLTVVGTIFLFVNKQQEEKELQAYNLLFSAEKMERDLGEGSNPFDPEFYKKMKEWNSDQRQGYLASLEGVLEKASGSQAAQLARLRLARLAWENGDVEKALSLAEETSKAAHESFVKAQAFHLLGALYEDQKDFEKAEGVYAQAAALEDSPLRPLSLMAQARSLKELGKREESAKIHESVIEKFPNSVYEKQARALKLMDAQGN